MEALTETRRMNTFTIKVPMGTETNFLRAMSRNMGWKATVRRPKAPKPDPTCMTKEEYFAMLDQRIAQAEEDRKNGRLITKREDETMDQFIDRLICTD